MITGIATCPVCGETHYCKYQFKVGDEVQRVEIPGLDIMPDHGQVVEVERRDGTQYCLVAWREAKKVMGFYSDSLELYKGA